MALTVLRLVEQATENLVDCHVDRAACVLEVQRETQPHTEEWMQLVMRARE